MRFLPTTALTLFFLNFSFGQVTVGNTTLTEEVVVDNLDTPWEILWGPDDYIWITERGGTISRIDPDTYAVDELLTINEVYEESESGLLGMALHPDFTNPSTAFVYLVYTYDEGGGNQVEKLVRYTFDGTDLVSPTTLLDDIPANNNHSGSRIIITPDEKILMTTGDAQNTSLSQNESSLAGKVLRIDLDGGIPDDNPDPLSYVYTIGHRNPQGLVLGNNDILYSSEHGPSNDDEINIIEEDGNYGWPTVQGYCNSTSEQTFCNNNDVTEPIIAWTPTLAVAGLDYYNHPAIPEWQNSLLLTTLKERDFRVLQLNIDGNAIEDEAVYFNNKYGRLRDVCVSPDGAIYFSTSNRDGRGSPTTDDDRIIKLENEDYIPTGTGNKINAEQLQFFPNPVKEILHTSVSGEITVYDFASKPLIQTYGETVNISNLVSGVYLVKVLTEDGQQHIGKVIKQ